MKRSREPRAGRWWTARRNAQPTARRASNGAAMRGTRVRQANGVRAGAGRARWPGHARRQASEGHQSDASR